MPTVVSVRVFTLAASMSLLFGTMSTHAQPTDRPQAEIRLWAGDAPGALGQLPGDVPTLTAYLPPPSVRNGASILIFPGGGYEHLSPHEGKGFADWFVAHGVTAYVLKYRLGPRYQHPAMLEDATRALRMVRAFAKRDGLDPARVGVIGSSAGGHLAAMLATNFDTGDGAAAESVQRESSRPDLAILCYPVISMGEFAHAGSKRNTIGKDASPELVEKTSPQLHVTPKTPPCFLWSTYEDQTVPVENTLMFATALRKAGVRFSLHIYEKGVHGAGMGTPERAAPPWPAELLYWLREEKFVP
jgi:acetyl esterase/lipase